MHRDANMAKRNAMVIPGLLLSVYSLIGILYAVFVRGDTAVCGDGRYVELLYGCRDAILLLAIPLVIGIALLTAGMLAFKSKSTCLKGHGTWSTSILVLLATFAGLPLLLAVAYYATQDPNAPYTVLSGETLYRLDRLLGMIGGIGILVLIPYLSLYIHQTRSHPCCKANSCYEPCFCDEPVDEATLGAEEEPMEQEPAPLPSASFGAPRAAAAPIARVPAPAPRAAAPVPAVPKAPSAAVTAWPTPPEDVQEWHAAEEPAEEEGATPYRPQCVALTAEGAQCRNSSRGNSKYCASHKGYQPPTMKGLAKRIEGDSWSAEDARTDRQSAGQANTRPQVGGAANTALAARRSAGTAPKKSSSSGPKTRTVSKASKADAKK